MHIAPRPCFLPPAGRPAFSYDDNLRMPGSAGSAGSAAAAGSAANRAAGGGGGEGRGADGDSQDSDERMRTNVFL